MYWTSYTPSPKQAETEGMQGLGRSGAMTMVLQNLNGTLRFFPSRVPRLHREGSECVCRLGCSGGEGLTAI